MKSSSAAHRKDTRQRRFVRALLAWYRRHGRSLPWRGSADPYRILVSEVMLQQTQASRVALLYPAFIRSFPSVRRLAQARARDVVVAWRGMGYNMRALRLHRAAQEIIARHGGRIPADESSLRTLPGIGEYTASAVLSFAHGRRTAVIDVNIRRVLSRVLRKMPATTSLLPMGEARDRARILMPRVRVQDWHQALMDLGATVCTARRPRCSECPVSAFCRSAGVMTAAPSKRPRERTIHGIPARIFRGRVVEQLRRTSARGMRVSALARRVYADFSEPDWTWLTEILHRLERDGLMRLSQHPRWDRRLARLA